MYNKNRKRDILAVFHRFHTKAGQFLLHNSITTQTASVQVKRFLLLSINGDLRLTLADTGFHYCQRYFSKRTQCLGRFPELQCCVAMRYAVKPVQTSCEELQDRQEARKAESSVCFLDFSGFFYFLTTRKHFTAV